MEDHVKIATGIRVRGFWHGKSRENYCRDAGMENHVETTVGIGSGVRGMENYLKTTRD